MTTVMAFGSFDVLHPGHIYYLKESKRLGDKLVVVVAKDSTIKKIKGQEPKYTEKQRLEHVRDLPMVDKAVLGYEADLAVNDHAGLHIAEDDVLSIKKDHTPVFHAAYDAISFAFQYEDG